MAGLRPSQLSGLAPDRIADLHIKGIDQADAASIATALFRHAHGREPTAADWAPNATPDVEMTGGFR